MSIPGRLPFSQKSDDERVIQSPDLAASLRDVTNSCKFSWLLALLDHVREGGAATVAIDEMVARMVARG